MHVWLLVLAVAVSGHSGTVRFGGLPVPGVSITASQGKTKFSATTDGNGIYTFSDLPEGIWTLEVQMLGFSAIVREVTIASDAASTTWDLAMLPMSEMKAEVIAAATVLPSSVNASNTSNNAAVPPQNDNPSGAFANLSPDELNQRAADSFLINGSVNNGAASPFAQLAAFGNNRSGGRRLYNGGIGAILDNSSMDARSFSLTGQDTAKPAYNYFQGAITLGGPLRIPHIIRNGPNFFVSYQRTQNRNATTQTGRMPTVAERNGDLSQAAQIVIPRNRISPQALALLNLFPLPNFDGGTGFNYQIPVIGITHQDILQLRLNKAINTKNQASGSLDYQSTRNDSGNLFGFMDTTGAASTSLNLNWSHRFDQRLSVTVRYIFNRSVTRTTPYFASRLNVSGEAGITGNNQEASNWGPPNLSFASGFAGLSSAQYSFDRDQTNGISTSTFVNRGRHNFTFGGDVRRQQLNVLSQQDARGSFTFTGAAAGFDFAGFLEGTPDASAIAFGNADKYFRASNYAAFLTDDWRMNAGLTLNLGVRWEYEAPMTELYGRLVNLDIARDFSVAAPVLGGSLIHSDKLGVQPRVGFAWRPIAASSLVVRGGYGIYRNTAVYPSIVKQMAQQSPLSRSLSVENSASSPLTLANGFDATALTTSNTFAIDPDFRVGTAHAWNLSVQRDLPASLQMVATYLGNQGSHLSQKSLPNTFPAGVSNPCAKCPSGFVYLSSNGSSTRHAGQIQLRRRLRNGFTASVQYTLSKAIDDAALGAPGQGAAGIAQNWLDLRAEKALSNFDQRHLVSMQAQYTTGVGVGGGALLSGWQGALLKEWTLTTQITAGSGSPLTPIYPVAVKGTGFTGSIRPDLTGVSVADAPNGFHLNPAAYSAPASGQWGNAGRNSITGPGQFGLDAGLGRSFAMGDRFNVDFRLDSTNVLNHVTFPAWNTTVNNAQFGLPNRANGMRKVQATLRLRF